MSVPETSELADPTGAPPAAEEARRLLDESQAIGEVGSWSHNVQTGETTWSAGQFRLYGLPLGRGVAPTMEEHLALVHPEDRPRVEAVIVAQLAEPGEFADEYRIVRPDGTVRTLQSRATILAADPVTGQPARFAGFSRDVTAERAAQAAQRDLEQRHRRLLTSLPDTMVVLYDTALRCELVQGRLAAELGIDGDVLTGRRIEHTVTGDQLAVLLPGLARALSGATTELALDDPQRGLSFQIEFAPYLDEHGEIAGAFTVWRDVTRQVREVRARREAEEQLRVTVEHAPIGVALVELTAPGRLVSANDAFTALLEDVDPIDAGRTLADIAHPDNAVPLTVALKRLRSGELTRFELEVRAHGRDGATAWLLLSGAAVPDETGPSHLAVVHALDIGERKRYETRLQHLADHDPLTGLFNRRRFESELGRVVAMGRRYGTPAALLMLDLDGFKHVNDRMGHSLGDELIIRVGEALRDTLRETDVIGRLGGDEFAVVLNAVTPTQAAAVADKILDAVRRHGMILSERRLAEVTASVGIVAFDASGELEAGELLLQADLAMYRAKDAGKNRAATAGHDGPGARLTERRSWNTRLRAAIAEDRFELHAQPIRRICASGPERYELLLRMRGENGELIAPGTFLYNAERFDLIQEIDRWVFAQALELLRAHHAAGRDIRLSLNVSGKTLSDPDLIADLTAMLADCPIPRDRLIVEVTETAAIVNIERAREVARALRTLGCRFALDDFGAGFASFYYLKHLDFDYVKIDGEFVRSLGNNATDPLVIRSVVDIARGLGAQTIAEFVGDETTVTQLRELGVDYGQGYHLGRPGPLTDILPGGPAALTALLTPPVR